MTFSYLSSGKFLVLGLLARVSFAQDNPCKSFGVDFVDGGSYFQNSLAQEPFTFVSKFEGTSRQLYIMGEVAKRSPRMSSGSSRQHLRQPHWRPVRMHADQFNTRRCSRHGYLVRSSSMSKKLCLINISPQNKTQLYSGSWSLIIISNNGNADPIAYQRDFSLSVGPQLTTTYTPSVTIPVTYTPVVNTTGLCFPIWST